MYFHRLFTTPPMCTSSFPSVEPRSTICDPTSYSTDTIYSVQVNVPAESGEMGILAQHVPSIEQLKPGLVEVIEESGGSKQFFREQYS